MATFPVSKYARYKRATAFFLDWILQAHGRGRHAAQRVELEASNDVVKEIAAEPGTLTPKLLQELPKALAACQCAITLREHVATFFAEDDAAQSGHKHFLELLKRWQATLKTVLLTVQPDTVESERFENYYNVLEVDEDYFPDEETFVVERGAPKTSRADRKRMFDEAFAEDLRLEVVYFFLELEELVEGVFNIYDQVKKQQRTMVEATVVVKLAMDMATTLTARLQLRYPALKTAEDVINVVKKHMSKCYMKKMIKAIADCWKRFETDGVYTFIPGMVVRDFISVWETLDNFTNIIPTTEGTKMISGNGFYGEMYGEERTPHYVLPDPSNLIVFLVQQLPLLYNTISATKRATGNTYDESILAGSFMALMDEYFTSRQVTMPIVFTCICWLKSVAALQGKSGLTRNVSLTFKYSMNLMRNMEATVAKGSVLTGDRDFHEELKQCAGEINLSSRLHNLARANPLMAGFMMLTFHFRYLHTASEILLVTSRFRAFGHIYNALVQQQFLQHIPFFDEVLKIYDQMIFTPSRAAAIHGSYNRTYLLSSHWTATAVNAMHRGVPLPAGNEGVKLRKVLHFRDLSKIFRLLTKNDKTVLGGASSKTMLKNAADICSEELFRTRVLSRDILKLNDDLTDVFSDMCDELGQRQYHDDYITHPSQGESRQCWVNQALEDAVMMLLMPLLDCLQLDGSLDYNCLPFDDLADDLRSMGGEVVKTLCWKVASVIKAKFATPSLVCEQKYFTFPLKPDFINQEYGDPSGRKPTEGEARNRLFNALMALMEDSVAPLSGNDLEYLKSELRRTPSLLTLGLHHALPETSLGTIDLSNTPSAKLNQLCSLFHQAAAGSAYDADLVEWMIGLGALALQSEHCRHQPRMRDTMYTLGAFPNTMAVHSACIVGNKDIVRIILEADNMIDLNTPTFHTKETLVHLAVKHGHRKLYDMLVAFGADLRIRDGNGKRVCDLTNDREWKCKIASIVDSERRQTTCGRVKNADSLCRKRSDARAERLRQSLAAQRDQEHQRTTENTTPNIAQGSSKRKSKKKGKKGKANIAQGNSSSLNERVQAVASGDTTDVPSLLTGLLVATGLNSRAAAGDSERISQLESSVENAVAMFSRLRDPGIPAEEKVEDVQQTCKLIKKLQRFVEYFSHSGRRNSSDHRIRNTIASGALRVIHLMHRFYRVDHAAIAVPALDSVRDLCDTSPTFVRFVIGTAQLSVSVGRKPQAREIMDMLEKRMLKTRADQRSSLGVRELVETYSAARDAMGLGQASSPNALYDLSNTEDEQKLQGVLDKLAGRNWYLEFTAVSRISDQQFSRFEKAVRSASDLGGVVCFERRVMYGVTTFGDLRRSFNAIVSLAKREGMIFAKESVKIGASQLNIRQFAVSKHGVTRYARGA